MEIVKGRDFDRNMGTDKTEAVLINETGVKTLGWEDDPIGKKLQYGFDLEGDPGRIMKVIGVVKDFHYRSLHNKIEPIIFFLSEVPRFMLTVRLKEGKEKEALAYIEEKWNSFGAGRPFDYRYITQILEDQYEGEKKIGVIFNIATMITIFIALLGLANSLVWPAIWPLAIHNLGGYIKTGTALLIMAIAGGALLPLLWGKLSDTLGSQQAYVVLLPCYLIILFYAVRGYKLRTWK